MLKSRRGATIRKPRSARSPKACKLSSPELRAALLAEPEKPEVTTDVKPEDRELRELIGKASIGEIVSGALRNKPADGASKELQEHYGLAGNEIPLELLRAPVETRAITAAPSDVGAQQDPIVQPVFAEGDAAFLGARETMLAAGDAVFQSFRRARQSTGRTKLPRVQAIPLAHSLRMFWSRLEFKRRLATVGRTRFDSQEWINRFARLYLADCAKGSTKNWSTRSLLTFPERARARWTPSHRIDRDSCTRWSMDVSRIRKRTFGCSLALLRWRMRPFCIAGITRMIRRSIRSGRITGGLRVSPNIAAASGNKQDVLVRRGMRDDVHVGLWPGIEIIDDQLTNAATGEVF